jgi:selenocysteine lyase/cysteine desulfurase
MRAIHEHETALRARLQDGLASFGDAVTVHSKASDRTPTYLMSLAGHDARDAHAHLASRQVVTAAGSFYAYEPFRALNLEDPALRVGLAPYTSDEDVDRLLAGLDSFL